jgi:hypothetical protein
MHKKEAILIAILQIIFLSYLTIGEIHPSGGPGWRGVSAFFIGVLAGIPLGVIGLIWDFKTKKEGASQLSLILLFSISILTIFPICTIFALFVGKFIDIFV